MSCKKTNSTIHVPFSWEKMPGVPKFMASPMSALVPGISSNNQRKMVLPLPPAGSTLRQSTRSMSERLFLWEEDPFLAAIIECTKDGDNYKGKGEIKKSFGSKVRMSKSLLSSCKHSFDVEEGQLLIRPSSLGSIVCPERVRGFIHIQEEPRKIK